MMADRLKLPLGSDISFTNSDLKPAMIERKDFRRLIRADASSATNTPSFKRPA
ncbi:hypothetical protein BDV10DRAFT_172303 [Aspergillus recurvatus]